MLRRLRSLPGPSAGDLAIAAVLTVYAQVEVWVLDLEPKPVATLAALVMTVALVWRRREPLRAVMVIFAAVAAESLLGVSLHKPNAPLAVALVALYSLGAHAPWRPALLGVGTALAGIWTSVAAQPRFDRSDFVFTGIIVSGGWLVGRGMHGRVRETAELERRTTELERTREAERQAAVAEERSRIARELHDMIAHSLSVMVVQAGAAEEVAKRHPERVAEPLRSIQETGRQALTEMSRLLGILRGGEEIGLAPQPGLDDLEALLEQTRRAGLPVDVAVEGIRRPLPPGPDLSAYRILQEALTNARKHAGPATVHVTLRYRDEALEIEVLDDGPGARNGFAGGHGLIGMRERVAVFGGELQTGPRPDGGFAVRAELPLDGAGP
jgi:signal transduction histidine kinase